MTKKPIRILFIISNLSGGGAERVVSTILKYLNRDRFECMLCLWREEIAYPIPQDVPVRILGKYKPWHLFRAIRRTCSLVNEWKPDIVYSHLSYVNFLTGLSLLGIGKRPIWIPCEHSNPFFDMGPIMRKTLGSILNICYKLVAVSDGVRKACLKGFSLAEEKVITIYNPMDLPEFCQKKDLNSTEYHKHGPTLVAMGRLVKAKDYPTLLKAFQVLREKSPAMLRILGTGPLQSELENMAVKLGIADWVDFVGFVNDPFPLVRSSDVYVMSSRCEGLPTALIEAMACGIPVVSTRAAYGPEEIVVDGISGLLVDIGDTKGLADSIFRVLQDPDLRSRLSKAGIERAHSLFSWENQMPRLEKIFVGALEKQRVGIEVTP